MIRASVVLPLPGGPWRIIECGRPSSIARRSADPGASSRSWPTNSSSVRGPHPRGERRVGRERRPARRRSAGGSSLPNSRSMPRPASALTRPTIASAASCSAPLVASASPPSARARAGAVGEPPARLLDDHLHRGEVPQRHLGLAARSPPRPRPPACSPRSRRTRACASSCRTATSSASSAPAARHSSISEMHSWASASSLTARRRAGAARPETIGGERARALRRPPAAAQRRRRDDTGDDPLALLERDQRRPHRDPAHVVLGPVDRVDDPPPRAARRGRRHRTPRRAPSPRAAPAPGARGAPARPPGRPRSPASGRAWSPPRGRRRGSGPA